ncbi:MAG TPA: hypothetical protein VN522_08855 [Solirubrobacterales bacterium]|nr:hypothetical protein [Solirubrobacterales bacterium]
MVSPIDKNGGSIAAPEGIFAGGVLQASADGSAVTYGSAAAFGEGAQAAPAGSQYLSSRTGQGWATANLTVPLFSGSYFSTEPAGVPYQLFSPDLNRSLLLNGHRCRSVEGVCPVANPPLPGTAAPVGFQNYYLRQEGVGFRALLTAEDLAYTEIEPADFELSFAGATPSLEHVLLSSCAALAPGAGEAPSGAGCDPTKPNLYEWSGGALGLVNVGPGATLAAQSGAISADGGRIYFVEGGNLFLRQGATVKQVDAAAGGGGGFQVASADGSLAYFTQGGHLWQYVVSSETATDLTPAGGVLGVLGASEDGTYVYYVAGDGVHLLHGASDVVVAAAADASDYPPATGTARVSGDGSRLVFVSSASLTGYDNTDLKTGLPDSEVFLYEASASGGKLRCVSCRPTGLRPTGSSTIPGSVANGQQSGATDTYKPRVLSADGSRVFFNSADAVVNGDSNGELDVFQWEAPGAFCAKAAGCISLISGGRDEDGATFVDASVSGNDVFFVTGESLDGADPGSVDLYDARVGGGVPTPLVPIPCFGDSCQSLPSEPEDPGLTTQVSGPGNPKEHYVRLNGGKKQCSKQKCKKKKHKKKAAKQKHAKTPAKKGARR